MEKQLPSPMRILVYMLKWLVITAILGIFMDWVQSDFSWKTDVLLYIRDFLFIGSYYHLWFLPALAFALWLVRKSQVSKIKFLSGLLLCVVGLAFESYWFILSGNDSIEYIRYCYKSVFVTTRNGLFIGVPCVIIGQHLAFHKNTLIISGISAGFSSVFGTPLAGTLFGGESFIINQIALREVNNLLIFSIPLALVVVSVSLTHLHYQMGVIPEWSMLLFFKVFVAGIAFGLIGWVFSRSIVFLKARYAQWIPHPVWRNTIGGAVVVAAALILQTQRYLGLTGTCKFVEIIAA
ncbi:hypothetical protein EfmAA242_21030 [Enterococcus faecium]|nr:hypothetical protein EfmAA242_21030 [Enterococcus faecium]